MAQGSNKIRVNTIQLGGTNIDTNSGNKSAGTQRVVLATDQPAIATAGVMSVKVDQTTPGTTNRVDVGTVNSVAPAFGSGVRGATVQRVTVATDDLVPVSGTVTANAGTNLNTSALALDATLTGRTQKTQITDGTRDGTVKAASTAAAATDTALVVAISPNNTVPENLAQVNGVTVLTGTGATGTGAQRVTVAVDSATVAGSASLPTGTNTIGAVTGPAAAALALDATLTGRTQKTQITDGTRDGTVKAASTAAVAGDTALVVAISPNNSPTVLLSEITATGNITTQNLVPAGTATAGSAVQTGNLAGMGTAAVQVTGVYTGALSAQGMVDGSTWVTLGGTPFLNINTGVYSATIASAATGIYQLDIAGFKQFRITGLAAMTGTATVSIQCSNGAGMVALDAPLPTGANVIGALSANQSVNVAQINGVTPLMGNGVTGTGSQRVTIASDGTAISTAGYMSVKIDQTTPGTTNLVAVAGTVAQDGVMAGNPVPIGVRASNAIPTAMSADGDVVYPFADRSGRTVVTMQAATSTLSNVAGSATSVTVLASNTGRKGAIIVNDSTAILYIKFGATASTSSYTAKLQTDDYYEVPFGYTGIIDGIWASAAGNARVTEIT